MFKEIPYKNKCQLCPYGTDSHKDFIEHLVSHYGEPEPENILSMGGKPWPRPQ